MRFEFSVFAFKTGVYLLEMEIHVFEIGLYLVELTPKSYRWDLSALYIRISPSVLESIGRGTTVTKILMF